MAYNSTNDRMKKIFTGLIAILLLNFAVSAQQNAQMSAARSINAPTKATAASKPVKQNGPIAAKDANDGVIFSEDFENGITAWQNIDSDGDGWFWEPYYWADYDNNFAMSRSYYYDSVAYALTPDNWLISPSFTIPADGAMLTWYDLTFNTSWPAEHYSVYVKNAYDSTSSWQSIFDYTLTADDGQWNLRSASLDNFSGQTIQIAFRHWNCSDMVSMGIDNVTVTSNANLAPVVNLTVTDRIPAGTTTTFTATVVSPTAVTYAWYINGSIAGTSESLTYTWNTPGEYYVELAVTNQNGTSYAGAYVYVLDCDITSFPYFVQFNYNDDCWSHPDWRNSVNGNTYYISFVSSEGNLSSGYLTSPLITVPTGGAEVSFSLAGIGTADFYIYATTDDENYTLIGNQQIVDVPSFTEYTYSLAQFAGQTIRLRLSASCAAAQQLAGVFKASISEIVDCNNTVTEFPMSVVFGTTEHCWTRPNWINSSTYTYFYPTSEDTLTAYITSPYITIPNDNVNMDIALAGVNGVTYNIYALFDNGGRSIIGDNIYINDSYFNTFSYDISWLAGNTIRFLIEAICESDEHTAAVSGINIYTYTPDTSQAVDCSTPIDEFPYSHSFDQVPDCWNFGGEWSLNGHAYCFTNPNYTSFAISPQFSLPAGRECTVTISVAGNEGVYFTPNIVVNGTHYNHGAIAATADFQQYQFDATEFAGNNVSFDIEVSGAEDNVFILGFFEVSIGQEITNTAPYNVNIYSYQADVVVANTGACFGVEYEGSSDNLAVTWDLVGSDSIIYVPGMNNVVCGLWTTPGTYTITCTVTNDYGSATAEYVVNVVEDPCATPVTEFPYFVPLNGENENENCWQDLDWYYYNDYNETNPFYYYITYGNSPLTSAWITLPASGTYELDYDVASVGEKEYSVILTNSDGLNSTIFTETINNNTFNVRQISLAEYAGQTFRVTFQPAYDSTGNSMALQDFIIREAVAPEVTFNFPETVMANDNVNVYATVHSALPVDYHWYAISSTGDSVDYGTAANFTTSWSEPGDYTIYLTVGNAQFGYQHFANLFTVIACDTVIAIGPDSIYAPSLGSLPECWSANGWNFICNDDESWCYTYYYNTIENNPVSITTANLAIPDDGNIYSLIVEVASSTPFPYSVYVNDDEVLNTSNTNRNTWYWHGISLANYAGQTVKVSVRSTMPASKYLYIDFIGVRKATEPYFTQFDFQTEAEVNTPIYYTWYYSAGGLDCTVNWDLDGGIMDEDGNIYWTEPGTYTVTCTVTNEVGSVDTSVVVTVIEQNIDCSPITEFPYYEDLGSEPNCWYYIDDATGELNWAFDGYAYCLNHENPSLASADMALPYNTPMQLSFFAAGNVGLGVYLYDQDNDEYYTLDNNWNLQLSEWMQFTYSLSGFEGHTVNILFEPIYTDSTSFLAIFNFAVEYQNQENYLYFDYVNIPNSTEPGQLVNFNAGASSNQSITYVWTIADENDNIIETIYGQEISYVWDEPGTYNVSVCVYAGELSNCYNQWVSVESCDTPKEVPYWAYFSEHQPCWYDEGWQYIDYSDFGYAYYVPANDDDQAMLVSPFINIPADGQYTIRMLMAGNFDEPVNFVVYEQVMGDSNLSIVYSGTVNDDYFEHNTFTFEVANNTAKVARYYIVTENLGAGELIGIQSFYLSSTSAPGIGEIYVSDPIYAGESTWLSSYYYHGSLECTFQWTSEGAVFETPNASSTYVYWTEPGTYAVTFTISNALGSADTTFYVTVLERDTTGDYCANLVINQFPYTLDFENGLQCWEEYEYAACAMQPATYSYEGEYSYAACGVNNDDEESYWYMLGSPTIDFGGRAHILSFYARSYNNSELYITNQNMDGVAYTDVVPENWTRYEFEINPDVTNLNFFALTGSESDRVLFIDNIMISEIGGCTTDTIYIHDTVYVNDPNTIHDTVYVVDTVTIVDTTYIHNTVTINDTVTRTITMFDTVHTTLNVTDTVYNHVNLVDTVHTTINVTDTVVNTVEVDSVIWNFIHSDTIIYDTLPYYLDTIIVYDTTCADTIYIFDTIIIHDTVVVSIDTVDAGPDVKIYSNGSQIVIDGAQGRMVKMYDAVGRLLATKYDSIDHLLFDVPSTGAYVIKVDGIPAKKIVFVK